MTEADETVQPRPAAVATLTVGALLWIAAGAIFVALRLAFIMNAPVGGFEVEHLAGAWQASIGETDSRFVPTLFQAIVALTLRLTESEYPGGVLALLASATVPFALYLLRERLGNAGALLALFLLAVDAPAIALGASASAMGFDVALTLWLFVLLGRRDVPDWAWAVAAFLLVTGGPLPLPLVLAAAVISLSGRRYPSQWRLIAVAAGSLAGVVLASIRFGLGWDGLRVPQFVLFADGFDATWSSSTTLELAVTYGLPVLLAGVAAAGVLCYRAYRENSASNDTILLLAWALVSLGWFATSVGAENPVALAALTVPLALILGPALAEAATAAWRADWNLARYLVPAALFALALALAFVIDWARVERAGDANEKVLVAGFIILALSSLGYVASNREALPALFVPLAVVLALPLLSGASGVAFSSPHEPLPSPVSPAQLRDLRNIALELAAAEGGTIVIHADYEDEITWHFRDSGTLIIASRVPETASVVIWPLGLRRPDGYDVLAGDWNIRLSPRTPDGSLLDYVRWYSNRNVLPNTSSPVAVYVRAGE